MLTLDLSDGILFRIWNCGIGLSMVTWGHGWRVDFIQVISVGSQALHCRVFLKILEEPGESLILQLVCPLPEF